MGEGHGGGEGWEAEVQGPPSRISTLLGCWRLGSEVIINLVYDPFIPLLNK